MKTIKDFVLQSWLNFCWFMFVCAEEGSPSDRWWNDRCCDIQVLFGYEPSLRIMKFSAKFAVRVLGR